MENFNEYKQKKSGMRVKLTYVRDSKSRLNPWEITHFISRITTYMYKIEVLNTIAMAINSGIEKKNIFVLDKAYRLNEDYTGCAEMDLHATLNRLYSMGSPEGMEPNQDLIELKLLFGLFYEVSQVLRSYGAWRMSGRDRTVAYRYLMKRDFPTAVEYIREMAEQRLRGRDDVARLKNAMDRLTSKCEKAMGEYNRYLSERKYFAVIEDKLNKKTDGKLSADEEQIVNRYYKKFYQIITDSARPIVGIYDAERCVMRILCADHFDAKLNKNTKIDLKSVTQNSPIMGELEAGYQIFLLKKEEKRKKELFELEREKRRKELNILKDEETKAHLDVISSALEVVRKANELADDEENRGIKALAESYAKEQIGSVYAKVQKGYADTLYKNGFREAETRIIDVKV